MVTPVLQTERLVLRPLTIDDAPAVQRWFCNWNIIQHLTVNVPWPYPDDGAVTFLRDVALPAVEAGKSLVWAITESGAADQGGDKHGSDELVGMIDYTFEATDLGNRGFWLAEHLWGLGYMTEAVTAMQDYVLLELGVERIVVLNSIKNPASRRIKEKTGARLLGQTIVTHHNGESVSDRWEVTREQWTQLRGGTGTS